MEAGSVDARRISFPDTVTMTAALFCIDLSDIVLSDIMVETFSSPISYGVTTCVTRTIFKTT